MKKRIISMLLAALFTVSLFAGCDNGEIVSDTTPAETTSVSDETETAVTDDGAETAVAPSDTYRLASDVELAEFTGEGIITYENKTVEYDKDKSSFGLYLKAKESGGAVVLPKGEVSGVYPILTASETEKTVYKFDLSCDAPESDYSWFTFYFGLRLESEAQDPTKHIGVWIAMRSGKIGMRTADWPTTVYFDSAFDFSAGGTVIVIDDPVENVIKVCGGSEDNLLATVKIEGDTARMYAPGKDNPAVTDKTAHNIIKGGYAHLWNHITATDVTIKNISASLAVKNVVKAEKDGIMPRTKDIFSDTWSAVDDTGRVAGASGTEPNGKKVGMFYFLWHETSNNSKPLYDHTKAYMEGGMDGLWKTMSSGALGYVHYWGEPYFGYYASDDEWVIRKHGAMLSEAGVDFVYFDTTNGPLYKNSYEAVLRVWSKMRSEGLKTPDACFILKMGDANELNFIWKNLYSVGLYEDMWFKWEGKPVIMFTGSKNKLTDEQKEFFTVRLSWATEADNGWYSDRNGVGCWPWASMYKQKAGYRKGENGRVVEQMAVMAGFWANGSFGTNAGRSYTKATGEPKDKSVGDWNMGFGIYETLSGLGLAYQECFDYAIKKSPELIMITGWNEWWGGRWEGGDARGQCVAYEYFVSGNKNDKEYNYFVDNLNPEYSRDIEPMKGGFTDNYYYQTVINVRKYKGSRTVEAAFGQKSIDINGDGVQWLTVGPEYRDVYGDTAHRDHLSHVGKMKYTNTTGRNDIVSAKVSEDGEYLYFLAECADNITAREGENWMNLFLKTNYDESGSGWNGFDYIINRTGDGAKASVEMFNNGWDFVKVGDADIALDGKTLSIKVKKELVHFSGATFEFKWADNSVSDGDIMKFLDEGDAAPDGRFCYVYTTEKAENKAPECLTADMAVFKANGYNAFINGREIRIGESTKTTLLASGHDFYLPKALLTDVLGIDCDGETEYDHYGVTYVKANAPVEKSGRSVTVTPDGLLIISNEKITDEAALDTLYRALH